MSLAKTIRQTVGGVRPGIGDESGGERESRPRERPILACEACGYSQETGDGTWIRHDPTDPLWVYECPECGHVVRIGAPATPR